MTKTLDQLITVIANQLTQHEWRMTTAESCTGGGVAYALTSVSGSSGWFDRGAVTYSNAAKVEMLGVNSDTIDIYGAVSEQTAVEMALGAVRRSHAEVGVAITGIAGPTGGTPSKPVGLVWFAWVVPGRDVWAVEKIFGGDREKIREQSIRFALEELGRVLQ